MDNLLPDPVQPLENPGTGPQVISDVRGHIEEIQGFTGRSGIPYDPVVPASPGQVHNEIEQGLFLQGRRGTDVVQKLVAQLIVQALNVDEMGKRIASALISTASRRSPTALMVSPISPSKMSEREGVASDVIISVLCPEDARCNATAAEQVVLPTPPLPPNIIIGLRIESFST
jgi:hypothetical protein